MEELRNELEILNYIESTTLQSHDKFLCRGLDGRVMIISHKLRNYIKTLYPKTVWIDEANISKKEWDKIAAELPINYKAT